MLQKPKVVPVMLEKVTAMLDRLFRHAGFVVPEMVEKITAMQDRLFQRCLKSSQPFRRGCSRDVRNVESHARQVFQGCLKS